MGGGPLGLDEGESIGGLLGRGPPAPALTKFQIDDQGFAWLPEDAVPPDAERQFATRMGATTVEVDSGHVVMISHPDDVTALLQSAVDAV